MAADIVKSQSAVQARRERDDLRPRVAGQFARLFAAIPQRGVGRLNARIVFDVAAF
jgi:hypothetical protein